MGRHMADRLERLCKRFTKELQMKHLCEFFSSLEYQSVFNMSDDIQMPCISEAASSDLDPSSVPNFTELFNLLQEDPHLWPPSSPDSDLDPESDGYIDRDTDLNIDSKSSTTVQHIQAPCSDDADQSTHTTDPKEYPKRIRRKALRDKTLLAQCLLQWLDDPQHNPQAIKWISKKDGLFQIIDSTRISSLWGGKKENKKKMNHEKLSRALRHYYKDGTLEKQSNKKRLCYKFSKSAMQKFNIYFTKQ